jgi:hypothetical protein
MPLQMEEVKEISNFQDSVWTDDLLSNMDDYDGWSVDTDSLLAKSKESDSSITNQILDQLIDEVK